MSTAPTYTLWLSLDPVDPSSPSPALALAPIIESLHKESPAAPLPPRITLIHDFPSDESPTALLDKLSAGVASWKKKELSRHHQLVQPMTRGPIVITDASGEPMVEGNPEYDPHYVVRGLPLKVDSVRSYVGEEPHAKGSVSIAVALHKDQGAIHLFEAVQRELFQPALAAGTDVFDEIEQELPPPAPESFPLILLYANEGLTEEGAVKMIEELRRKGEVRETKGECEVGGIGMVVASNVLLMERDGEAGKRMLREVGKVSLA